MSSNRSCDAPHGWIKPRVEQAFARFACLTIAEFRAAVNAQIINGYASNNYSAECKSQAPHSSAGMIEKADRSSESAEHGNCHRKQSGVARSPQSGKKTRR